MQKTGTTILIKNLKWIKLLKFKTLANVELINIWKEFKGMIILLLFPL